MCKQGILIWVKLKYYQSLKLKKIAIYVCAQ